VAAGSPAAPGPVASNPSSGPMPLPNGNPPASPAPAPVQEATTQPGAVGPGAAGSAAPDNRLASLAVSSLGLTSRGPATNPLDPAVPSVPSADPVSTISALTALAPPASSAGLTPAATGSQNVQPGTPAAAPNLPVPSIQIAQPTATDSPGSAPRVDGVPTILPASIPEPGGCLIALVVVSYLTILGTRRRSLLRA
jgi:hypothetical protein